MVEGLKLAAWERQWRSSRSTAVFYKGGRRIGLVSEGQQWRNRQIAKGRAAVEHVLAAME